LIKAILLELLSVGLRWEMQ